MLTDTESMMIMTIAAVITMTMMTRPGSIIAATIITTMSTTMIISAAITMTTSTIMNMNMNTSVAAITMPANSQHSNH